MALLACGFLPVTGGDLAAQGVTTAAISGIVTTDDGVPLATANVIAIHQPSGRSTAPWPAPAAPTTCPACTSADLSGLGQLISYQACAQYGLPRPGRGLYADFRLCGRREVSRGSGRQRAIRAAGPHRGGDPSAGQVATCPRSSGDRDLTRLDPRATAISLRRPELAV
jgi:hypothetical protein